MTPEHRQSLVPLLESYKNLELEKKVAEAYKDYQDLTSIFIGYYSVLEFVKYSNRSISLIEEMLNSPLFAVLPHQYQFQNDFGGGNLRDDLAGLNANILISDFNSAIPFLYRLVFYFVQIGYWEKEVPIKIESKKEKLNEFENKLLIYSEQIRKNSEDNIVLKEDLRKEKENLINLITTKNQELSEIVTLLSSSRIHTDEINKLFVSSTDTNQQIIGLLNQQDANLKQIKDRLKEEKDIFDSFQKELKELKEKFEAELNLNTKFNSTFEKQLENVNLKSNTFEDRLKVLNELIGKEGAVKLFNTFNDRKKELEKPVKNWSTVVFLTGISAFILIISIFTNFFGYFGSIPTVIDWQYLLINSLKSIPIMIILYFAISQYAKERNFQEEYAFRSAIALTIQAYADIAGTKKEELISKAVENIFSMPSMMKEKNGFFIFNRRLLSETLKDLNETMKNLKS